MPQPAAHPGSEKPENRPAPTGGFTLLEVVAVLVILSLLAGIAISKYLQALRHAEIAAEDATIANLQASVDTHWATMLIQGQDPAYPRNPFSSLKKLPAHYQLHQAVPSGAERDRHCWTFVHYVSEHVQKLGISLLDSENAPALLKTAEGLYKPESVTRIDGLIFHQRRNGQVYFWIYDQSRGVISNRYKLSKE